MISFITKPGLPDGMAASVICGKIPSELRSFFDNRSIEILSVESNDFIDPAVKYHADMAVFHLGGKNILLERNQKSLTDKLREKGFNVFLTAEDIKGEYPSDIKLNFLLLGNMLIGKTGCEDSALSALTAEYEKISVRQGYCRCSCLLVNDNAVITDDRTISSALCEKGVEVLLVEKGDVSLEGHKYGFIGGAACRISRNEILFFGDITKHRNYRQIKEFCSSYNMEIIDLAMPLTDIGGVIVTKENC